MVAVEGVLISSICRLAAPSEALLLPSNSRDVVSAKGSAMFCLCDHRPLNSTPSAFEAVDEASKAP